MEMSSQISSAAGAKTRAGIAVTGLAHLVTHLLGQATSLASCSALMPPNARPLTSLLVDHDDDSPSLNDALVEMLDQKADTDGLANINGDNEDWTDVKHSERKKRDRLLDDGVLIKLMRKSDYKGFERLFVNLSIMAATAIAIHRVLDGQVLTGLNLEKLVMFLPLYVFYGFQFQCFAFAGQHEFLHRNAFKTKFYNDACLFLVGLFCFELGAHEKVMHKQVRPVSCVRLSLPVHKELQLTHSPFSR